MFLRIYLVHCDTLHAVDAVVSLVEVCSDLSPKGNLTYSALPPVLSYTSQKVVFRKFQTRYKLFPRYHFGMHPSYSP